MQSEVGISVALIQPVGLNRSLSSPAAHGGSYSIYYALALSSKELTLDHRYVLGRRE